jgi:transcriptional regulator with XRE-family HTH domain
LADVGSVVGSRLRELRVRAGLSQSELATVLGRQQGTVSSWEAGRRAPGLDDLVAIADALAIPVGELFAGAQRTAESPALLLRAEAGRLLRDEVLIEIDLFVEKAATLKIPPAQARVFSGDPVHAAHGLLRDAAVGTPPVQLPALVELCGVGLLRWGFDRSLSGLLVELEHGPVIGFNKRHPPNRARFTVAHELGHHLLRHFSQAHIDLAIAPSESGDPPGTDWALERDANRFASELLMPAELLVPLARSHRVSTESLADRFKVSVEAMGFRLVSLGLR